MYNCLQKKSAQLLKKRPPHRLLASLFVFMMILTGAQAVTYYWVGGDLGRWNVPANWNTQADGNGTQLTGSFQAGDSVIIPAGTNRPLIGETDFSTNPVSSITINEGGTLFINTTADFSSVTTFSNAGTLYFCNKGTTDTYTFTTPASCNLGNIYVWGKTIIEINGDCSATSIKMEPDKEANQVSSNFTVKLSEKNGSADKLTIGTGSPAVNLTRASATGGVIGTFEIDVNVNCAGTIETHSGVTLKIDSGKTLTAGGITHSANNGSPASKIENLGTIDVGPTGTIDLSGNNNAGCTQLVNSGAINAGTIKIGSTDTKEYNNTDITNPIINNGTIEVSSAFTLPNFSNTGTFTPYSGNGQITLNGTNASFENKDTSHEITINSLEGTQSSIVKGGGKTTITTADFTGAADISGSTITNATFHDDITLSGANTFTSVTATGLAGKTLTVNAEQTFQSGGTVTLSGTGDSNLLTVTGNGSGKFILGTTTLTGEYLSLNTDSSVVSASTGTAFAQNSETTGSGTTSWIVTSAGGHLWNGENGNWETAANWLPQSVPATTDEVIINSGTPKINSAVTVKSITVNGGGINLLSNSLTVETLSLADSTSVTTSDSTTINISDGQKIDEKITGDGKLVLASGKNYTIPPSTTIRIDIENDGSLSSTGAVTFSGDFTNSGTGTASFDGSVTVSKKLTNTGSATFTGGLYIAGDLEGTGSLTGAITFNGTGDQTFSPNNVIYSGITVDKSAGTLSVYSSLQVTNLTLTSGAVSINGDLTLLDGTDYQNYDFSSVAGTLTFTGGSSASPRVLTASNITNSSKISADYLKLQAQGSSDIILNSCENISNLTLETDGNISVNGITADSISIASGAASVKMKDTITLTSTSQDFIIDYPLLLTGDTTFSIIKDIKVQGTGSIKSDTSSGKNLSLTANSIQLLNGNALGDSTTGALGTISINSNLTLGADTQLYSSQINFAGTGAKNLSGAYKLSATGNVTDNGEWTWAAGSTLLFNGSADQTFKTNTNSTYKDIAVNKTTDKFILDTSVLKADNLTITNCEEIHFTGVNEITTVANLSFTKPVTADNNLTISNTSGNVSFTDTFTSFGNLNIPDVSVTFGGNVTAAAISTKATTINCSKIQTSGNQNYAGTVTLGAHTELESSSGNISFTSTVDGANTLKLTSSTGTSFGGNVGASTSLASLEVNGTSNINCASITTSGDQTYNGPLNLEAGGTSTITGANTGTHIDFKDTINGSNTFSVTAASTTFENTVGATTALASLEVTGTANINCNSIKTTGTQTYNGEVTIDSTKSPVLTARNGTNNSTVTFKDSVSTAGTENKLSISADLITENTTAKTVGIETDVSGTLTNKGTTTFGKVVTVSSSFTNETGKSATFNENVTVSGAVENNGTVDFKKNLYAYKDVTDNGSWTLSGTDSTLVFTGTDNQKFTPVAATTYQSILIDKTAGSFTTDTNALQVSSFADSATNASTITFATDITIGGAIEFHTAETVAFTNTTNVKTTGSTDTYHNITHTSGLTKIEGTITAGNITLRNTELTDSATLTAHGDVQFNNDETVNATIDGAYDLTINANDTITFNGNVGTTIGKKLTYLTLNGTININCNSITTTGDQTYDGTVNLKDGGITEITGANVTFDNTVNGKNALTVTSSGDDNFAAFKGDVGATTAKELTSLTVNGNTKTGDTLDVSIITSGNQTYNGTVTLNKSTTFTARTTDASPANQTVKFKQNVTGSNANTILTCNANIQVESITMAVGKEIDFAGNISGSDIILTINTPTFKSTATSNNSITVNKLVFEASKTSIQSANAELNFIVPLIDGSGEIKLEINGSKISFTGDDITVNPKVTSAANTTLTASSGSMTLNNDVNLANGTFTTNNGTIILNGADASLSGNNTFNNLIIQNSVNINGSNEIANLTAGTESEGLGGKTITFMAGSTQTVTGSLKLNGISKDSRLKLRSSSPSTDSTTETQWIINCNASQLKFLDVQDSNNTSANYLFAYDSWDSGNNTKWNFPGMVYNWKTNAASSDWNTASNWLPASIPGIGANVKINAPADSTKKHPILTEELILNDSISEGTIEVLDGATFNLADQDLTVGTIINKGLVKLTGAVTTSPSHSQTISGKMKNETGSTVEYYGTGDATANFAWDGDNGNNIEGKQYENLIISRAISQNTDEENKIQISGTTTIIAGATNSVSLDNAYNIFSGHVILGNQSTTTSAGTVTLNGTGTGSAAIFLEENIFADNLTLNSNVQGDNLTITAPLTINCAKITTTGSQTYNSAVTLTKNTELESREDGISFASTVEGVQALKITSSTGTTFDGVIGGTVGAATNLTSIEVNGPAIINTTSITTSDVQTYNGAVTLGVDTNLSSTSGNITLNSTLNGANTITFSILNNAANSITVLGKVGETNSPSVIIAQAGTVIFNETVKANAFSLTKANSTTFEKAVDIATLTDDSINHTGSINFAAGVTIRNDVTFNTNNTISFTGIVNMGTDISRKNLTHTSGNTIINGTFNAADVTLSNTTFTGTMNAGILEMTVTSTSGTILAATTQIGNLTLSGDTTITTSGIQTYNGTINDATAGTHTLELNAGTSHITFSGNVGNNTSLKTLTINSPLTLNCELIRTTGAQTYHSPIVISSDSTETITSTEDGIHFADTVTINDDTTISAANDNQIIFDKAVTGDTASSLTTNATTVFNTDAIVSNLTTITTNKANINSASITSYGTQTFNGTVSIGADTTLTSTNSDITLGASLDGAHTITFSVPDNTTNTITISGKIGETNTPSVIIAQAGNVSFAQTVKSDIFKITKANDTHFAGTVTSSTFEITQANSTQFDRSITVSNFTINQAASTTFDGEVAIASFTDTVNAGNISFNAGGRIQNDVIFNTDNTVSLIDTVTIGDATPWKNLTHSTGNTIINGTLNAADVTLSNTSFTGTMNAANVELSATSSSGTINAATTQIGNLTLAGNTSITTSGTQAYNGTINDSLAGAHTLELNSGTSQITFTSNVGSTPIKLLTVTGPLTLNCESIQTTGPQTYNSPVVISSGTTETITSTSESIHFADSLTINDDTNISVATDKQIVFDKAIIGDTASSLTTDASSIFNAAAIVSGLTSLTTNKAEIHCPSITSSDTQTYNRAVIFYADTTLTSTNGNIILASTLDGAHTITFSVPDNTTNSITISGQVGETNRPSIRIAQAGNISFVNSVKTNTFTITKANNTHFTDTLTTSTFEITQTNNTKFDSTVTASVFTINQAANTTFDGEVTLASFTDNANAGNISFNEGGAISNTAGTIFSTNGLVTFGNNSSDDIMTFGSSSSLANLKHTAGNTSITGILNAADVAFADTSFEGIMNAANITLGQTDGGPMTINNSGLFTTTDSSALTYTTSFSQIGNGNAILGGSFTGSGNASFATNLQIYGSSQADFGAAGTNINIAGNLIILRNSTDELNLLSNFTVTENFVLYKGPVTASADISTGKDVLIFGSSYSTADSSTGITDEYSYTTPRHADWSQPNYTEANLPDGTDIPTADFTATLSVSTGSTISVGKNFYANGTILSLNGTSGQWNLKLPDLTNPANGFAEAYHSDVSGCEVICNDGTEDGTKSRLAALECTDSGDGTPTPNTNVEFEYFQITKAYTVRDNVIRVEFNQPIRYHSSTINSLKFHNASDAVASTTNFTGFYSDPDCQHELTSDITQSYTDEASGKTYWYFYIKAAPQDSASTGAWNTDATGKNSGAANGKSSDRDGIHHTTLPCLDFPRALADSSSNTSLSFIITDRWGKRLNNYSRRVPKGTDAEPAYGSQNSSNEVADKTGPVLWTVRTGQELHDTYQAGNGATSQHSYDSHNFLEFRYSEPVDFYENDTLRTITENFQVTDELGAIAEDITSELNTITFAGLAKLNAPEDSPLKLYTGSQGNASKYVNALYRLDEYSIRLSIAGFTDGTVSDYAGNVYKKWPGYIEEASQFTGANALACTTTGKNNSVKDLAGNCQEEYASGSRTEPEILSSSEGSYTPGLLPVSPNLYSTWDLSPPVITPLRFSKTTEWGNQEMAEAIGNTNGSGSTLDRIDFHFFDNTPTYSSDDTAEWYTEIGWCNPNSEASKENLKEPSYTYCADIIGGSRQFAEAGRRTSGGIRFSTKTDISPAFKYSTNPNNDSPDSNFKNGIANVYTTIVSQLFTGSSDPMRPANNPDGLYLGLGISDSNLSVETTFAFSYNEEQGYLTDLAGNRLRSFRSRTIDRTPPSFDVILSPIDTKSVYIIFVKELETDTKNLTLRNNDGTEETINEKFETLIPKCFQLISIDDNGNAHPNSATEIQIDTSEPAQIIESNSNSSFTCIKLTTTEEITIDNIKNLYIQLIMPEEYPSTSIDPYTSNQNSRVTLIRDRNRNYMTMYSAHALSDFAINYVNPLYAYSSDILDSDESVMNGLYEKGNWAVHNWNANQNNYGSLPADHPISIVADTKKNQNIRIYLSPAPDTESVSKQFNKDFNVKLRVWLPNLTDSLFRALTANNNDNYVYTDGKEIEDTPDNLIFDLTKETVSAWKSGNQISFMFGLMENEISPVRIHNNPYYDVESGKFNLNLSIPVPLFCLRMPDTSNINSLDLWSFKVKDIKPQRGGVTILNNVINATNGEKTVLKVDVPTEGRINVMVMTLDGNIITYLHRGNAKAGENYFTWDGKNRNGNLVARGMYFIRVTGADFDETRKVMVVK